MNLIIEDETGVAQLRWYRHGEIPMIGTKVVATGDESNMRVEFGASGGGALQWMLQTYQKHQKLNFNNRC